MSLERMNFIGGQYRESHAKGRIQVFNPASDQLVCSVPDSNKNDVDIAVSSALKALPEWKATPAISRARILFRFRELLEKHSLEITTRLSNEHGKTREDSAAELARAIDVVEFACGVPELLKGEHSRNAAKGIDCWSIMQPVGVCVGITPFNFPAMVPLWMIPIALACGNTFVLKPSEKDPSAPALYPELLKEAGLPDGVLNLVHGSADTVNHLLEHPDVHAVSFVGSSSVAESIYQKASAHGKRVQALGGAKNHALVLEDADLDLAAEQLTGAAYGSAGERCMAISVVVAIGKKTGDQLVEKLARKIENLTVGSWQSSPDFGPLITQQHYSNVVSLIEKGIEEGADLCVDGRNKEFPCGSFIGPSLFDSVTETMSIYQQEIFGPVLCVVRVESYEEALRLVNQHSYGNGAAIYTRSGAIANHFCEQCEAGMVGVNVPIPVPVAWHCFGGWKNSMFGPLNMHGPDGVRFFTKMKTVTSRWPESLSGQLQETLNIPVTR
ncbi:methylmalonate-semialdehyde dehydrogenase (CoA acylating) [Endozoicomonas sp. OPT23]|uniref:CoA-acylating methylmalonate-semialdehyde dehydrogenase n=1 Tax=Endozoicomonas sp. OPT23 TaxID=2072845 RepID=UPI001891AC04|nr:CoA-acylating methylmalonate-semialdehyde dehydrogenase [Endozoicomonas sp. OPT23]MRI33569.1 methylmalonate-semialdehyde dehydrogenase (CoA acylating) [Endozoicomonas sp. OPT23]